MLRLERSRAAGKGFLGTGLGKQPSDHWVLGGKKSGAAKPPGNLENWVLHQPPVLRFPKPETSLAPALLEGLSQKQMQPLNKFLPGADSQNPPPQSPIDLR